MGSVAPGGFWPFKPLIASSASIRLSNRINPTPRDMPAQDEKKRTVMNSQNIRWQLFICVANCYADGRMLWTHDNFELNRIDLM